MKIVIAAAIALLLWAAGVVAYAVVLAVSVLVEFADYIRKRRK